MNNEIRVDGYVMQLPDGIAKVVRKIIADRERLRKELQISQETTEEKNKIVRKLYGKLNDPKFVRVKVKTLDYVLKEHCIPGFENTHCSGKNAEEFNCSTCQKEYLTTSAQKSETNRYHACTLLEQAKKEGKV